MLDIVGTWNLEKHGKYDIHGVFIPTSNDVAGKLIYSNDGHMTVLIHKTEEPKSLDDIISYSGRFTIGGDVVTHVVELATSSHHRNSREKRVFKFQNKKLVLSANLESGGRFEAIWAKEE